MLGRGSFRPRRLQSGFVAKGFGTFSVTIEIVEFLEIVELQGYSSKDLISIASIGLSLDFSCKA